MIIVISGQPGNGKSLKAMELMRAEYERNQAAVREGKEQPRRFFSNIEGATQAENPQAFPWVEPIPFAEPLDTPPQQRKPDWRLCPDGSYVLYDEAHADGQTQGLERYGVLFPGTGKPGESDDSRIRAMSTHRHRGMDLVFMSQWPSKIHHNIRQLAGEHVHMNRAMGLQRAGVVKWSRVQSDPYDEKQREKAEEEIWAFPQDLYGRYKSTVLHTASYKFRVPKKVWTMLARVVMLGLVGWALWVWVFKPTSGKAEEPAKASLSQGDAAIALAPVGAGGPRPASPRDPLQYADWYTEKFQPRIPQAPWSAPAYDQRDVSAKPTVYCMSSKAGYDAQGEWQSESVTCLTEQGTLYSMPENFARGRARFGPMYDPFKEPEEGARQGTETLSIDQRPRSTATMGVVIPDGSNQAATFPENPPYECDTCGKAGGSN